MRALFFLSWKKQCGTLYVYFASCIFDINTWISSFVLNSARTWCTASIKNGIHIRKKKQKQKCWGCMLYYQIHICKPQIIELQKEYAFNSAFNWNCARSVFNLSVFMLHANRVCLDEMNERKKQFKQTTLLVKLIEIMMFM